MRSTLQEAVEDLIRLLVVEVGHGPYSIAASDIPASSQTLTERHWPEWYAILSAPAGSSFPAWPSAYGQWYQIVRIYFPARRIASSSLDLEPEWSTLVAVSSPSLTASASFRLQPETQVELPQRQRQDFGDTVLALESQWPGREWMCFAKM